MSIEVFRLVRFGLVGIVVAALYACITFLLVETGLCDPIAATIIGHLSAVGVSYWGHLHFSFAVAADHRTFLVRFLIVAAIAFAMNIGITWLLTEALGASPRIAIATVTLLLPAVNYLCNRFWVFLPGLQAPFRVSPPPTVARNRRDDRI